MTERESNYVLFNIPLAIIAGVILIYAGVALSYKGWSLDYSTLKTFLGLFTMIFILDLAVMAMLRIFTKKMIVISAFEVLFSLLLLLAIIRF